MIRRFMAGTVIALSMLAGTGAMAADKCKLSALELPITMVGSQAITTVGINGTPVKLVVDSGAFFSMLSDAAVQQLKLPVYPNNHIVVQGLTGEAETHLTSVKHLQLLDGELPDVDFIVGGNEVGAGGMGLLGRNILAAADAEYDLAHGVVRLMFPKGDCREMGMAYWAGDKPVAIVDLRRDESSKRVPAIRTTVEVNGKKMVALFDTGASSSLSLNAAHRAGIADVDMKRIGTIYGVGRGSAKAWAAPVEKIEIGGETLSNNRLEIDDIQLDNADMLLGIDFFLSHRIYVSKAQHRMYFTYNGGHVFALSAAAAPTPSDAASQASEDPADEPTDAAGYARRGEASASRLDFVHALADLDRACEMAPDQAEYFVRRGAVQRALRHGKLAQQDYDTALRLDPAEPEALWQRAVWRANNSNRDGALEDLQMLDKTVAPQAQVRRQMAQLYDRLDLPDRQLQQLNQWIPAHPHEIGLESVLNSRCWARTMLGVELDKAVDDCDDALDEQPKNASFLDSRAWLRLRRGELRKALDDYDRAIKIRPDSAWSLYGRGIVRTKLGDAEQGHADIEAARKLLPSIDAKAERYGLAAEPGKASPTQ